MVYPREVPNRLKWNASENLDEAIIQYVHRGAPGDVMSVNGSDIVSLDQGFFETADSSIPYHRIVRIEYRGRVVFDKERERSR